SHCRHCSYNCGISREGIMDVSDGRCYIHALCKEHDIGWLSVIGGEPLMVPDLTNELIRCAKENGIPHRGIITNGFWGRETKRAQKILKDLKDAGMNQITFSVDAFHQEHIPFSHVRNAIMASTDIGFDKVWVDGYYLKYEDSGNRFDKQTKALLDELRGVEGIDINTYRLRMCGRAVDLQDQFDDKSVPQGICTPPFWMGGGFENPSTIEIDHRGNVTLCPGISIGNAKEDEITAIVQTYDVCEHPILSIINEDGPLGLAKLADNFDLSRGFVDHCHLCYELRNHLRPLYPRYLTPADVYQ
ncbi:MAG TPA: radical SAM protein, partial [Methanomicrobia archaeon]|nr:radical SAM protein [Methanomicrobia archaeon]